jgi:antibiotic biosynthesis monooxygenase (ABM) superfamily enzyme
MSGHDLVLLAALVWGALFGWFILPSVIRAAAHHMRRRSARIVAEREARRNQG